MTKKDFESDILDEEFDCEEDYNEEEWDREDEQAEAEIARFNRWMKVLTVLKYALPIIIVLISVISASIKSGISWKHDDYKFFWKSGDLYVAGYYGEDVDITLPSQCFGIPVAGIKDGAFQGFDTLTGVTIPDGYTRIGLAAFRSCTSLKNVTIPDSVTAINHYAFIDCLSLESITIPVGVRSIGKTVFFGCTNLTSILVDDENDHYCDEDGVLMNMNKKQIVQYPPGKQGTAYSIPDTVFHIYPGAFCGCKYLESIDLPEGVSFIEDHAFSMCESLQTIVIPGSVSHIFPYLFSGCSSLVSVTISDGVTDIGIEAFSGCTSLTSITIPDSVTDIETEAFSGCENLIVTAPHEPDYYGYTLDEGVKWVIS